MLGVAGTALVMREDDAESKYVSERLKMKSVTFEVKSDSGLSEDVAEDE